jgi:shikimate dehydrogenase
VSLQGAMPTRPPISGRTRVVGIIGDPVAHSRSPAMHNAAFAALGLDWVYLPFPVAATDVRAALQAVRALGLAGVNVTVPHKEAVLPYLDALSPLARQLGAVNTIVNRRGRLYGDNTDAAGFLRALQQHQPSLRRRHAIVIGAGGAARAVLAGLGRARIGRVTLANRTPARARALARRFRGAAPVSPIGLAALADPARLADAAVIVNATSIGLSRAPFPPLAYAATPRDCLFYDLLDGRESELLRRARAAGRTVLDGTEMLVQQGACAFALWTRRRAPIPIMRAAIVGKS